MDNFLEDDYDKIIEFNLTIPPIFSCNLTKIDKWDMIIAFPPCTYLTVTGNRWFNVDRYGMEAIQRKCKRYHAFRFFMMFVYAE